MTTDAASFCARPGCGHPRSNHGTIAGCSARAHDGGRDGFCTCSAYVVAPVTPYDGGTSSGHSGSDASRDRSERRDADGSTARIQSELLDMARDRAAAGVTVAEARGILDAHHGTVSGSLSNLHKDGQLARLQEKRDRCHVYVIPEHVNDRETRPQGRPGRDQAALVARLSAEERHTIDRLRHLSTHPNATSGAGPVVQLLPTTAKALADILDRLP